MIDYKDIPKMFEVTAVQVASTLDDLKECVDLVNRVEVAGVAGHCCFIKYLREWLSPENKNKIIGGAGFPHGGDTTYVKVTEAKEMLSYGAAELDMMASVCALKSGLYDYYRDDIRAVVEACNGVPTKAIIEVCYLTDDEIKRASELAVEAGVTYVKTGTGWGPTPTTIEQVRLIRQTIGDAAKIKVAGGVRSLKTVLDFYNEGVSRFGIGTRGIYTIMKEIEEASKG